MRAGPPEDKMSLTSALVCRGLFAGNDPTWNHCYFRKRFSKAARASRGLEVEVSRSTVVRMA